MAQITLNSSGVASSGSLLLQTNGTTTQATVDTSGNLGLGVTPSAWGSGFKAIDVNTYGAVASSTSALRLFANSYNDGTNWTYKTTAAASRYDLSGGAHAWLIAASGTAGNAISFTQAMTLDASGNLGVGTTSPVAPLTAARGNVTGAGQWASSAIAVYNPTNIGSYSQIAFGYTSGTTNAAAYIGFVSTNQGSNGYGDLVFGTRSVNTDTQPTERARIDSSGNLLVGTTATVNAAKSVFSFSSSNNGVYVIDSTGVSGAQFMRFDSTSSTCGSIVRVAATSAVTYNTTSDYRLKDVIGVVSNSGQRIDALEPVEFSWKADGSLTRGFLAHKFQEVYPLSVTGTKDAVDKEGNPDYQSMQAGSAEVIADLVAEIQSLRKRIAALENK